MKVPCMDEKKALVEVTRLLDKNSSARLGESLKLHKSKRLLLVL